jgi:hypothetical protein
MNRPASHSAMLADAQGGAIEAELHAYNQAFDELELPWRWDAATYRQVQRGADPAACIGEYIERSHAHLLRAYDKAFLSNLILSVKERRQS